MPIPTDTFWNIKRLNWVFAISSVALVATCAITILQDYSGAWRTPQKAARTWDAALTEERIQRELTDAQKREAVVRQQDLIAIAEKELAAQQEVIDAQNQLITKARTQIPVLEFRLNTRKAELAFMETKLQDATTLGDENEITKVRKQLVPMREEVGKLTEEVAAAKAEQDQARERLKQLMAKFDAATKAKGKLTSDLELLQKRLESIAPQSFLAKVSNQVRAAPLMGFLNPSERVQQVVLTDVHTEMPPLKVPTVDRCVTCHINIANKEFSEPNILGFLEKQLTQIRKMDLPQTIGAPTDPQVTAAKPGAVAMPEFWHAWGMKLAPDAWKRSVAKLRPVTNTVGKQARVTYDGQTISAFAYDPVIGLGGKVAPSTQPSTQPSLDSVAQNEILLGLLRAWYGYRKPEQGTIAATYESGKVKIEISVMDEKAVKPIRNAAMRYPDELRQAIALAASKQDNRLLRDRNRYAMVDIVNATRKASGQAALDPSPVLLAHPDLSLYVDADSLHPYETVGCTSCHDGSGQETDFVLTAHKARNILVDAKSGEPVLSDMTAASTEVHHAFDMGSMLNTVYPHEAVVPASVDKLHVENPSASESPNGDASAHGAHPDDMALTGYIDPVTGKSGKAISQIGYWKKVFEPKAPRSFALVYHEWDWPMRTPEFIQTNCVRCHTDVDDISQKAPIVHEGRYLFTNLGCSNCHQVDAIPASQNRKVGTDLRHVNEKLSPAFLNTWIWAPKAFRPTTKMPHFFMLENNSSDEELRRTRQEARAITEYLVRTATPLPPKHVMNPALKGSPDAGRLIFNSVGCLGCHQNLNDPTEAKRNNKPVSRGEQWIVTDLIKNGKLKQEMSARADGKDPDERSVKAEAEKLYDGMTYNQRQLYVLENFEALPNLHEKPLYPDGSAKPIFTHQGPELSGIGTKLLSDRTEAQARAWLFDWVKEPRHYSDYTIMPSLRLSDQEAADLVEYLLAQKRTSDSPDDKWSAGVTTPDPAKLTEMTAFMLKSKYSWQTAQKKAVEETDGARPGEITRAAVEALTTPFKTKHEAEAEVAKMSLVEKQLVFLGKKMISHYGCMSCHSINGLETTASPCANLSDWGQKAESKLAFEYLDEHKTSQLPAQSPIQMVNGLSVEAALLAHGAVDWNKEIAKPVQAAWPSVHHYRNDWLVQKLKNSRAYDRGKNMFDPVRKTENGKPVIVDGNPVLANNGTPYDKLKMPTFYLNDQQVHALVTFVITNREQRIGEALKNKSRNEKTQQIAYGRELVTRYACVSCHVVDGNVPQVQQYYKTDDIMTLAPPSLRGEGNKVQHNWLFNFFKNVELLRPLLWKSPLVPTNPAISGIRMPSFPATDAEWTAIIAYFAAASNKESRELHKKLDPVVKYVQEQVTAAPTTQPRAPAAAWPGDDWYTRPEFSTAAGNLKDWSIALGLMKPLQLDPTKLSATDVGKGYREALTKARFIMELYDSPYPFVDTPRPEITQEKFKLGEQLFYEMQCLKCHVLGDPSIDGAQKNPTAPNLSLTSRRLQRRWVRHWVQEPGVIQVGTAMPPFLTGMPIFDVVNAAGTAPTGQPWPRSQNGSPADIEKTEARFGNTADLQADLVLDFLYAAGVRGYTGIQPVAPAPTAPATKPAVPATQPAAKPATRPVEATPKPEEKKPAPTTSTAQAAATPVQKPVVAGGKPGVSGKVAFSGPAPEQPEEVLTPECSKLHANPVYKETVVVNENNTLKNVVVYVSGGLPEGETYPTPTTPVVLDQVGCVYVPHVIAMKTGQTFIVKNSDDFLHNVHSLSTVNPSFNKGQSGRNDGEKIDPQPVVPEQFRIKCDVHPWMSAFVHVFDHPYFSVTGDDGTFAIPNLPPGTYTLTAWHEQFGTQERAVTVEAGKPLSVEFSFNMRADSGAAQELRVVSHKLHDGPSCCEKPASGS